MKFSCLIKRCAALAALALLCAGCGAKETGAVPAASSASQGAGISSAPAAQGSASPAQDSTSSAQGASSAIQDFPAVSTPDLPASSAPGAEGAPDAAEPSFSFADLADRYFYFSSGAGGWHTEFSVDSDGSFSGFYQDSDMGDTGPDYPNGTVYFSAFSGCFTEPQQVNDTTYVFQLSSLKYENPMGQEVKDGVRYLYTDAYGLTDAKDLYLYLPGSKIETLPEQYRSWVGYYHLEAVQGETLPFYGLYNEAAQTGFSSYPTVTAAERAQRILAEAEATAAALEQRLQNDASLTQGDMNLLAQNLYTIWDDTLNDIWGILKETLDGETMRSLTSEQLQWIVEKEAAAKAASAENQGGSLAPLLSATEAAQLTKERVYALSAYLS